MQHSAIDQHAGDSVFSSFDPRTKIVGIVVFVVGVALLQSLLLLGIALSFILILLAGSSVPARHLGKRFLLALPFILFASLTMFLTGSLETALAMFLRITASVLALLLLATTTPFFDLLKGLRELGFPNVLATLLMFTYRYIFVFSEELQRMKWARKAKNYRSGKHMLDRRTMRMVSYTIGMVLVRAYERGLRVYDALRTRAFDGNVKTLAAPKFSSIDAGFCLVFILMPAMLVYYEWAVL